MKLMAGASKKHKSHYNPMTVSKPPEELERIISPLIEQCKISLNVRDDSYPIPAACDFPEFMEIGRTVLLQDAAQLINICRAHILFDHGFFKTE